MRLKIRNQLKILVALAVAVIVYNEHLVYYLKSLTWPSLECDSQCMRILIAADSQILGERPYDGVRNYAFSWDSNRYLAKTFARAVAHFAPDAVFFLGDVTYDGSVSTDREFKDDVALLMSIFKKPFPMEYVWIPGDNDIGGENEPIYPDKVKRYNRAFPQPDYVEVKGVSIYKANNLFQKIPKTPAGRLIANKTRIVLTHIPLLLSPGKFTENVLIKLRPSVIFSGHKHSAFHLETTLDAMLVSKVVAMTPQDVDNIVNIEFQRDSYHEFVVPTCSYRMGVPNMGYSVAVIEKSKYMTYTILWSPRRFEQLLLYVILLMSAGLYFILIFVCKILNSLCWSNIQYSKV